MSDKKDVIDTTPESEVEVKEEKKENAFSKFIKKTKQSVSDAVLENKIEAQFRKEHSDYSIYTKGEAFGKSVSGNLENLELIAFGKHEIKPFSIVISEKDNAAYQVVEAKESTCKVVVEGVEYERPATLVALSGDVTEVQVVKAGKRYFLYKGE